MSEPEGLETVTLDSSWSPWAWRPCQTLLTPEDETAQAERAMAEAWLQLGSLSPDVVGPAAALQSEAEL